MAKNEELICNWCGRPAQDGVWWQYEILCEHCWKWIIIDEEMKKQYKK